LWREECAENSFTRDSATVGGEAAVKHNAEAYSVSSFLLAMGAVSMNFIYGVIDEALLAQGIQPPAPSTRKP